MLFQVAAAQRVHQALHGRRHVMLRREATVQIAADTAQNPSVIILINHGERLFSLLNQRPEQQSQKHPFNADSADSGPVIV